MKCVALIAALTAALGAMANSPPIAPPHEVQVAKLIVLKRGETSKETPIFSRPGSGGKALKILPPGTVVYPTGEKEGKWSEVWANDVWGAGWILTDVIRLLEPVWLEPPQK